MNRISQHTLLRGALMSLSFCIASLCSVSLSLAQSMPPPPKIVVEPIPVVELSILYVAERSKLTYGNNFWMEGGSAEAAFPVYKGLGLAMNVTGTHVANTGSRAFSKIGFVAGPRYTLGLHHRSRVFAEAMFGGVHGLDAVFPATGGATFSAKAFAMEAGGGYDIDFARHVTLRLVEASYVRNQLPNGSTNTQNDVKLAAGIVFRFPTR